MISLAQLRNRHHYLRSRSGCIAASRGRIVESLDILHPLVLINTFQTTIIGHQPVDFTLNVGGLGPNTTTASEPFHLILELAQKHVAAVVPGIDSLIYLVCLIDGVDGCLVVPEAINEDLAQLFPVAAVRYEKAYCSIETLLPTPPNSPWKPIRVSSYGLELIE